jgi:hypothetical protein
METSLLKRPLRVCIGHCMMTVALLGALFLTNESVAQSSVLVVRPEGSQFRNAVQGMVDDLGSEMPINELILDRQNRSLDRALRQFKPSAVILMDNSAIAGYRKWLSGAGDSLDTPSPAIALMGILVGEAITGMPNTEAISYEIPIVTSAVHLRSIINAPIKKIGVVHRAFMGNLIEQNRESCLRENIVIINKSLPDNGKFMRFKLKRTLIELLEKERVDALWVPNDNLLLSPSFLTMVWIPQVKKYRKPVIVGIEALANPDLDFGTLAVLPDHVALGVQAASLLLDARKNKWKVRSGAVEPSLSVYKILNFRQARTWYNVPKDRCKEIDKFLQ